MPNKDEAKARKPADVVQQAELQASSPERVREWFENRVATTNSLRWTDSAALERALLERGEPLITLAVARFGADSDVLKELWHQHARDNLPLRLAVLMNEVVGPASFGGLPGILVDGDLSQFMGQLDFEEIAALFSNPTLSDRFLGDFFEQAAPWQGLDDIHRQAAITNLTNNVRMQAAYTGPMDGWAEHQHGHVYDAAWQLSGKVPVTLKWAARLCWLYEKIPPETYSVNAPLELAARWVPDPGDTERIAEEQKDIERGSLGPYARMRKGLARLALHFARHDSQAFLTHADPAIRAACYFEAEMTLDQMRAAGEQDLMLSFEEMMWNPCVWRRPEQRELLRQMAWDSRRDPNSRLDCPNLYNARLQYHREEYPQWFKDEEGEELPDPDSQPVTREDFATRIQEVQGSLSASSEIIVATLQAQAKLFRRTAWIGWGVAAVLALAILKIL